MRILLVVPAFSSSESGFSNAFRNFAHELSKGANVDVIVLGSEGGYRDEFVDDNLRIRRIDIAPPARIFRGLDRLRYEYWLRVGLRSKVARELRGYSGDDYDYILVETMAMVPESIAILDVMAREPNHVGVRLHGTDDTEILAFADYKKRERQLCGKLLAKCGTVFATTPYYLSFAKDHFLRDSMDGFSFNFRTLPNIVPENQVSGGSVDKSSDAFNLVALGRMNQQGYQQKNFELLLFAISRLLRRRPDLKNRVTLRLIGDGEMREDLIALADSLGLANLIEFIQGLSHERAMDIVAKSDIALLLSRYEGQSMFLCEAMSLGVPVMAAEGTGASYMVEDGCGWLVNPDDPETVSLALENALDSDLPKMRTTVKESYVERFSPNFIVKTFLADVGEISRSLLYKTR